MSIQPIKKNAFSQGIYAQSSTRKEDVGTYRLTRNGRVFRYAKAGAVALSAGKLSVAATIHSSHTNVAQTGLTTAIGDRSIQVLVTAGKAIADGELRGGQLQVNDATGEGQSYGIKGNTAISASGTAMWVTLESPIRVATIATSQFTFVRPAWYGTTEGTTQTLRPTGITPIAVSANYYYWSQTAGDVAALIAGTPAAGRQLTISSGTAGAMASLDAFTEPLVGYSRNTGVAGEYKSVDLAID